MWIRHKNEPAGLKILEKNQNLYPQQSQIANVSLRWDTLYLLLWKTWSQFVLAVLGIVSPIPNSKSQYDYCFILSLDKLCFDKFQKKESTI